MVKPYGFGKDERLKKPSEFKKVLSSGRRITTPHLIIYVHHKDQGARRLGVSVSRRVGRAVIRNRLKRLLRETFRLNKHDLPEGIDIVVIVRKAYGIKGRDDITEEFMRAFRHKRGVNGD